MRFQAGYLALILTGNVREYNAGDPKMGESSYSLRGVRLHEPCVALCVCRPCDNIPQAQVPQIAVPVQMAYQQPVMMAAPVAMGFDQPMMYAAPPAPMAYSQLPVMVPGTQQATSDGPLVGNAALERILQFLANLIEKFSSSKPSSPAAAEDLESIHEDLRSVPLGTPIDELQQILQGLISSATDFHSTQKGTIDAEMEKLSKAIREATEKAAALIAKHQTRLQGGMDRDDRIPSTSSSSVSVVPPDAEAEKAKAAAAAAAKAQLKEQLDELKRQVEAEQDVEKLRELIGKVPVIPDTDADLTAQRAELLQSIDSKIKGLSTPATVVVEVSDDEKQRQALRQAAADKHVLDVATQVAGLATVGNSATGGGSSSDTVISSTAPVEDHPLAKIQEELKGGASVGLERLEAMLKEVEGMRSSSGSDQVDKLIAEITDFKALAEIQAEAEGSEKSPAMLNDKIVEIGQMLTKETTTDAVKLRANEVLGIVKAKMIAVLEEIERKLEEMELSALKQALQSIPRSIAGEANSDVQGRAQQVIEKIEAKIKAESEEGEEEDSESSSALRNGGDVHAGNGVVNDDTGDAVLGTGASTEDSDD